MSNGNTAAAIAVDTANKTLGGCMLMMMLLCGGCLFVGFLNAPSAEEIAETQRLEQSEAIAKLAAKQKADLIDEEARAVQAAAGEKQRLFDQELLAKREKERLSTITEAIKQNKITVIRLVQVADKTATFTVANEWHIMNKQIRLQSAQNLWQAWASAIGDGRPDEARIQIEDLNGNKVGGSRVWGGSLIWVND
jgi:alanyl-tRNA synthetase